MANTTGKKYGGRKKGTPNKITKSVREGYEKVFHALQRDENAKHTLFNWAQNNTTEFYKLASKLIPLQVQGEMDHSLKALDVNIKLEPGEAYKRMIEDESIIEVEAEVIEDSV